MSASITLPEVVVTAPAPTPANATPLPAAAPTYTPVSAQLWLRKMSLIVADNAGNGRELAVPSTVAGDALHVVFTAKNVVISSPATLSVRVYNLSEATIQYIMSIGRNLSQMSASVDYSKVNGQVVLKAGYEGNYGTIFTGGIRQIRRGRENPTDTFVDIYASDSDFMRNWGFVNTALSAGYSQTQVAQAVTSYMSQGGFNPRLGNPPKLAPDSGKTVPVTPPDKAPRGRAMYGPAKNIFRDLADTHDNTYTINNNTVNFLPKTAYAPGDPVILNSRTGMISMPQLQADGVHVRSLLNPAVGPGTRLVINNASIQDPAIDLSIPGSAQNYFPTRNADGVYKVLTVEHTGDNRGQNWYTDMVCISSDPSDPNAVPFNIGNLAYSIPP